MPYKEGDEIIKDLCSAPGLEKQSKALKRAQRYSVSLFTHQFNELVEAGAIQEVQPGAGIYHLDEQYYDKEFGWSVEPVGNVTVHFV